MKRRRTRTYFSYDSAGQNLFEKKRRRTLIGEHKLQFEKPNKMEYFYVYILQSEVNSDRFYVGCTGDLAARLKKHNQRECVHTKKHAPLKLKNFFAFQTKERALEFEKYLKSSSGRAFSKKHF